MMTINELKNIWLNLVSYNHSNLVFCQESWSEIETAYGQLSRYYHNLSHLIHLLNLAFQYQNNIQDFDTLLFSIFYHDIVYQIPGENNELKSADIAKKRLLMINYPTQKIKKCFSQIIATKNHSAKKELDINWLLDLDLAILGTQRNQYIEYTKKIRQEYAIYPDKIYNQGRSKILNTFLQQKTLYKTQLCQERFEQTARNNLIWELELLSIIE
ncbi:hypothetical protein [Crocosphaera sp.]|uniref:HD domain-containing protein n=1 Tax=Crocosphaera sp. TaxID=2729996 RepID=UPI0026288483|nr:hypothetical protein [Crocosphaera sp.]MDJ0580852.1 hypothetical protein [Crocosphaera sp.]